MDGESLALRDRVSPVPCPAMTPSARPAAWHETRPEPVRKEHAFEALEAEITELWGHISAATYRFLELVAEFDRSEGWGRHGVASCAQWLNLKCGIGPVAAREKVRVARALETLPKIGAAFRSGQISYSKVRAVTRVATPATEETLLTVALYGTATHVERLVRHYRRVERIEEACRANEQHRDRFLHLSYPDDDSVTIYGRLPAEVGALVEKAIEAACEILYQDRANLADPREGERDAAGARRADALKFLAEQFLASEARRLPSAADRYQVVVHIDQSLLAAEPDAAESRSAGDRLCEIEDRCSLAAETARRLACDGSLVGILEDDDGEPLDVGRKTRAISAPMRRALKARDGGCRFPGCDRTRFTEGHHVEHWANGGETKLSNLVTLCSFHHRLVHEGGFGLRVTDDGAFIFSRPDGSRIEPGQLLREQDFGCGDGRCFRGNIFHLNAARGVEVRSPPGWHGERMDYGLAIEGMLWAQRNWERPTAPLRPADP